MKVSLSSVSVNDRAKALEFDSEVLGFVLKTDLPAGDNRWLTIVSPQDAHGVELVLEPDAHPPPDSTNKRSIETAFPPRPSHQWTFAVSTRDCVRWAWRFGSSQPRWVPSRSRSSTTLAGFSCIRRSCSCGRRSRRRLSSPEAQLWQAEQTDEERGSERGSRGLSGGVVRAR